MVKRRLKEQKGIEYYMQLPYSILLHEIKDEGERYWIAEFPELPGCTSHGSTVGEAVNNAEEAKKDWILDSLEEGDEVPTPIDRDRFSGRTLVRMSRSLHRALSLMAESENLSLNQLIVTILAKEVGRLGILNRVEEKLDKVLDRLSDVVELDEPSLLSREHLYHPIARQLAQIELIALQGAIDDKWAKQHMPAVIANDIYYGLTTPGAAATALPPEQLSSCLWNYQALAFNLMFANAQKEKESELENKVQSKIEKE